MKNLPCFAKLLCLGRSICNLITYVFESIIAPLNPFWIQFCYFVSISFVGFFALMVVKPKSNSFRPKDLDIFFTSVSSATVSSMSTVEMEVFSNTQLVCMTILMLLGGEVFISMLGLQFAKSSFKKLDNKVDAISIDSSSSGSGHTEDAIELGLVQESSLGNEGTWPLQKTDIKSTTVSDNYLKYNSLRLLIYVVLGYLLVCLVGGSALVTVYLRFVPSAGDVLKNKGLQLPTFSVFTVVSTFSNCGFIPTNENMIVFRNNPGLLLLLSPQILLGNTLYPSCLRLVISLLRMFTRKDEFQYMLKYTREVGFCHLFPALQSSLLVFTVFGLILVQFILFCCMEWKSGALDGMTSYQKVVGALFQSVNARHAGESIVDLSTISQAVLVFFVVMMYLPPYTSFSPVKDNEQHNRSCEQRTKHRGHLVDNLLFSQLTYLVIFVILICITEKKKMKDDPLNFSLLNIVIEVVSAYGNVGFTTGYSCKRQINPNAHCKDTWYGFSGRWSNKGKLILILIMLFGRLKKFNLGCRRAWKLL